MVTLPKASIPLLSWTGPDMLHSTVRSLWIDGNPPFPQGGRAWPSLDPLFVCMYVVYVFMCTHMSVYVEEPLVSFLRSHSFSFFLIYFETGSPSGLGFIKEVRLSVQ